MRLADLSPQFLRCEEGGRVFTHVHGVAEADGIFFQCPVCMRDRQDGKGVHGVICWRPRVAPEITPNPGRWEFEGTGYDNLSLVAGSSSVLLIGGCNAHFFVRNGEIVFA